jgi:WD40 repeat protein
MAAHTPRAAGVCGCCPVGTRSCRAPPVPTADGHIVLNEVQNGLLDRPGTTIQAHDASIAGLALTPDGSCLATASYDRTIGIWDLHSGRPQQCHLISDARAELRAIVISTDGRLMAAGGDDPVVRLYDISDPCTPRLLAAFSSPAHSVGGQTIEAVESLALSPDRTLLAVGRFTDPIIRVWDVHEPAAVHEVADLAGHLFGVRTLAFSHTGAWLASGGDDAAALLCCCGT